MRSLLPWTLVISLSLLWACGTDSENFSPCEIALEQFSEKEFLEWTGLPNCSPQEILAFFKQDTSTQESPSHWRGKSFAKASFRHFELEGYALGLDLWFRGNQVICLEGEIPQLDNSEELLKAFGEPAAKLPYYFDVALYPEHEFVYPQLGIALFLSDNQQEILQIEVFQPQSLAEYKENVYYYEAPREFLLPDNWMGE